MGDKNLKKHEETPPVSPAPHLWTSACHAIFAHENWPRDDVREAAANPWGPHVPSCSIVRVPNGLRKPPRHTSRQYTQNIFIHLIMHLCLRTQMSHKVTKTMESDVYLEPQRPGPMEVPKAAMWTDLAQDLAGANRVPT